MNKKITRKIMQTAGLLLAVLLLGGCSSYQDKQEKLLEKGKEEIVAGTYEDAVDTFNEALGLSNGTITSMEIDLCYYKAAAQFCNEDYDGAIETCTALAEYDTKNSDPLFLRGCIYLDLGETDHAMSDFYSAVEVDPDDYEVYLQIYDNLNAKNDRTDALEFLNLALEVGGKNGEDYLYRGRVYSLLEQYDQAQTEFDQAIAKKTYAAYLYQAQAYIAQGKADEAAKAISDYCSTDSITAEGCNAVAEYDMSLGNYTEAYTYVEKGLAMEDVGTVQKTLLKNEVACLEFTGDFAAALDQANAYLESYPADVDMLREQTFLQSRN